MHFAKLSPSGKLGPRKTSDEDFRIGENIFKTVPFEGMYNYLIWEKRNSSLVESSRSRSRLDNILKLDPCEGEYSSSYLDESHISRMSPESEKPRPRTRVWRYRPPFETFAEYDRAACVGLLVTAAFGVGRELLGSSKIVVGVFILRKMVEYDTGVLCKNGTFENRSADDSLKK